MTRRTRATLAAAPMATTGSDAELFATCAAFHTLEASRPVKTGKALIFNTPECSQYDDTQEVITVQEIVVLSDLATMPAITLEGMRQKAAVLMKWDRGMASIYEARLPEDRLTLSLLYDLLAAGGA